MKIAIITRKDYRSPRILAESLKLQIEQAGSEAKIYYDIDLLNRLVSYRESNLTFHFWLRRKIAYYFYDKKITKLLRGSDAVVISECIPNGFWKRLYNVEKFKKIIRKPVFLYEVYYLGNAPTQIEQLKKTGNPLFERFDWYLSVTDVTEIKIKPGVEYSCVGLNLKVSNLHPTAKKEFIALVDFKQPGYDHFQQEQLTVLFDLEIKTIVLEGQYSIDEIRELYKAASVFFIQSHEAFGLPIAECLACGVQIYTASSAWPMSWRLEKNPALHSEGTLPEIFTVYHSKEDLKQKIITTKEKYDLITTPFQIFEAFTKYYPHFYYGNSAELKAVLTKIEEGRFD